MGTLYDQPVRRSHDMSMTDANECVRFAKELVRDHKITFDQSLKVIELMEQVRTNDLRKDNGDIWDEQIGGIGKCIDNLADQIGKIADGLNPEQ